MSQPIDDVIELLPEHLSGENLAEAVRLLEGVRAALAAGERAEASSLLSAACDIEYNLTGDAELVGGLFDELGLEDRAAAEGERPV